MPSASGKSLLLSLHIAASVGVFGADLVLLALGAASVGGADPLTIYPAARLVGAWVVAPLAILTLATGISLALVGRWRLFDHWWVTIKLAIALALTVAVLFVLVPSLAATAALVGGGVSEPLSTARRLPLLLAPAGASTLLAIALLLAVFKPGWRIRAGARRVLGERRS
jgi:hypothetical protein